MIPIASASHFSTRKTIIFDAFIS